MTTVLVTGFEPFEGDPSNPSWDAVRLLAGETIAGATIVARQLPCVFATVGAALERAIEEISPTVTICVGLGGNRSDVSVERVAINIIDARIPDNAGRQPIDEPAVEGGPAAYFSTLPIKAIVAAVRAAGLPASVSQTAGTFNCNYTFYRLAHHIATRAPQMRGGFIHVPYSHELAALHPGAPSMATQAVAEALRIAVRTALTVGRDLKTGGGAVS
jgi:pyroglutamyl-peptidase